MKRKTKVTLSVTLALMLAFMLNLKTFAIEGVGGGPPGYHACIYSPINETGGGVLCAFDGKVCKDIFGCVAH